MSFPSSASDSDSEEGDVQKWMLVTARSAKIRVGEQYQAQIPSNLAPSEENLALGHSLPEKRTVSERDLDQEPDVVSCRNVLPVESPSNLHPLPAFSFPTLKSSTENNTALRIASEALGMSPETAALSFQSPSMPIAFNCTNSVEHAPPLSGSVLVRTNWFCSFFSSSFLSDLFL
jgi:hypothetical protein